MARFVPNITIGPVVLRAIPPRDNEAAQNVHLMTSSRSASSPPSEARHHLLVQAETPAPHPTCIGC